MKTVHVVFGSERLLKQYAAKHGLLGQYVIQATHPELLKATITRHGPVEAVAVRYPKDIWEPASHACVKRVKETEEILRTQLVDEVEG